VNPNRSQSKNPKVFQLSPIRKDSVLSWQNLKLSSIGETKFPFPIPFGFATPSPDQG
jgi:hypothetical protein